MAGSIELIKGESFNIKPGKDWKEFAGFALSEDSGLDEQLKHTALGVYAGEVIIEKVGFIDQGFIDTIAERFAHRIEPSLSNDALTFFMSGIKAASQLRDAAVLTEQSVEQRAAAR